MGRAGLRRTVSVSSVLRTCPSCLSLAAAVRGHFCAAARGCGLGLRIPHTTPPWSSAPRPHSHRSSIFQCFSPVLLKGDFVSGFHLSGTQPWLGERSRLRVYLLFANGASLSSWTR